MRPSAPQAAVQAAWEIHHRLASDPHPDALNVSIGIDFGKVLLVDGCDAFGNAVNRAAKLGEDVAQAGETLATQEAFAGIPAAAGIAGRPLLVTVSGIDMAVVAL